MGSELVLRQGCIDGFSITVVPDGLTCQRPWRRRLRAPTFDTALAKDAAIHCERYFAMNTDRPTEPINTTLAEY